MKKVLLLCPTKREYRDLPDIAESLDVELLFDDFGGDYFDKTLGKNYVQEEQSLEVLPLIEATIDRISGSDITGVTSAVGYPGMSVTSIIAQRLGLPGPKPEAIMLCEHKYYCRVAQQTLVPEATPPFHLVDPNSSDTVDGIKDFPVFLKPVKSCMSMNAYAVSDREELRSLVKSSLLPDAFIKPFNDMVKTYTRLERHASYLLVEGLLEGQQVSLEGYVSRGKVHIMGIIDSIMFPGTISFKRFQYPSKLSPEVLDRMSDIATRFIKGIEYDNACFNIELIYNPKTDQIHIIEVNPKIASQFPDLFEKVDGTSSYAVMLQLALGDEPTFSRGAGQFEIAASCVLRIFQDQKVLRVPPTREVEDVVRLYPGTRVEIAALEGKRLSDQMQDVKSYRYGLINIGANSEMELEERFESCKGMLNFQFAQV